MDELQNFDSLKVLYEKDLHDVFGIVLDTFPNINGAKVKGQVYLWELLQKIKYNLSHDIDIKTYLTPKYVNGVRNIVYDKLKNQLPAICYNASFNGYKNTANLKNINNLMFLDIDDFNSKEEALVYKNQIIEKYDWIIACNLSLSKLGLHIIILVDKIIDSKDYNFKYEYISSTYFDSKLDKNSKSLTRFTIVPCDYNIYINEYPNVLDIDNIIKKLKGISSVYVDNNSIRSAYEEKKKDNIHSLYLFFAITLKSNNE